MSSTEINQRLSDEDQRVLLDVAEQSIRFGLGTNRIRRLDLDLYGDELRRVGSSFVTLRLGEQLRGCIGSIVATRPLVADVNRNAYMAAFCDQRFWPLQLNEFAAVTIEVSILSAERPLAARTFEEVLAQIRPGIDGVVIRRGSRLATFLPEVWQSIPNPNDFFRHLRRKAGIDPDKWDSKIEVATYTTQHLPRKPRRRLAY